MNTIFIHGVKPCVQHVVTLLTSILFNLSDG